VNGQVRVRGRARLVVLISGNGSNLQALLDASASGSLLAEVVAVFSNRPEAYGLERARQAGLPAIALPAGKGQSRREYDAALADRVAAWLPDWVVLAGWMRLLTTAFLDRFPGRVVNLHPALPGMFPGVDAIRRAFEAFCAGRAWTAGRCWPRRRCPLRRATRLPAWRPACTPSSTGCWWKP
jgi:formyltetrahydrofolate-dependent phosphoribosylglycinamide formyltransferase